MKNLNGPKILLLDIETAPMLAYVWGIWEENIGINQIVKEWSVLSWSAKWVNEDKIMYMDNRKSRDIENDKKLLEGMHALLSEADIVITQNGVRFDIPKLKARFARHGMKPVKPFKQLDTKIMCKGQFALTSYKLEYMAEFFKLKTRKFTDKDKKFPGFSMWRECLLGNTAAWREMERYNKQDVIVLEELYHRLAPWNNKQINMGVFSTSEDHSCNSCGSENLQKRGYRVTTGGKYQAYQCQDCGHWQTGKDNLLTKGKRASMKPSF